jgi:hypothetical protein
MYMFPLPSTATPVGFLNLALVPVPSVVPLEDPASVVTCMGSIAPAVLVTVNDDIGVPTERLTGEEAPA